MLDSIGKFKLKGEWSVRFVGEDGKEVRESISGTNIVTWQTYYWVWFYFYTQTPNSVTNTLYGTYGAALTDTKNVCISSDIIPEAFNTTTMTNTLATGEVVDTTFVPRDGVNPPYKDFERRINFTGARRIFRTIGLTQESPNNNYGPNKNSLLWAYSKIDPVYTELTLTNKTANVLTFDSLQSLTFATDKLVGQYITPLSTDLSGDSILANDLISGSNTGLSITVSDDTGYTIGNTYYLVLYPVQEENVVLFVNYRVTLDWDDNYGNILDSFKTAFENRVFNAGGATNLRLAAYGYGYQDNIKDLTDSYTLEQVYAPTTSISETRFQDTFMYKEIYNCSIAQGVITDHILFGDINDNEEALWIQPINNYRAPIQNQFPHSPAADFPFYSNVAENLPNGSLKPVVTNVSNNEFFPYGYNITIDQGGDLSTATYRFNKYTTLGGFSTNSFSTPNKNLTLAYLGKRNSKFEGTTSDIEDTSSTYQRDKRIIKGLRIPYGTFGFIQFGTAGISVVPDIRDPEIKNYNSSTHALFDGCNLYQGYIDYDNEPNVLYLACNNKGLLRFNITAETLTQEKACTAVGVGGLLDNTIVILSEEGVFSSADSYAAAIGDVSAMEFDVISFIKVDSANLSSIRLIAKGKTGNTDRNQAWTEANGRIIVWNSINTWGTNGYYSLGGSKFTGNHYDPTTGVFILGIGYYNSSGYQQTRYDFIHFVDDATISRTEDVTQPSRYVYGYTGLGPSHNSYSYIGDGLFAGAGLFKVKDTKNGFDTVINWEGSYYNHPNYSGTVIFDTTLSSPDLSNVYLLSDNSLNRIVMDPRELDKKYGWEGTQWVEDPDSLLPGKPLHSSTDTFIDNLNIRWVDLSPEEPFDMSSGEWFSLFINRGIMKDDYISNPKYNFYLVFRPVVEYDINLTIPVSENHQLDFTTVDPLFWHILSDGTDTHRLHSLEISGYGIPVEGIIINGSPGQNQIGLDSTTGGLLTFNTLDVGKTLTGKLRYTQKFHITEV